MPRAKTARTKTNQPRKAVTTGRGSAPRPVDASPAGQLSPTEKAQMVEEFKEQISQAARELTNASAQLAMERLIEHGNDLREMHDEGAIASAEEIRDVLERIVRDASDLIRTFDDRAAASEARDMHQGEAGL